MIRRLRKFVLITGTLLSLLIAVAFALSGWWMLGLQIPTPYGPAVVVNEGVLGVMLDDDSYSAGLVVVPRGQPSPSGSGPRRPSWRWWMNWSVGWRYSHLPLYAVFAVVAIPTLLVWRFVPKFPRGHCQRCGYNLTGLTEARCPECGAGFGPTVKRRSHRRPSRMRRVVLAYPSDRKDVTIARLALVVFWHPLVYFIVSSPPLEWLWVHASQFWYRIGVSSTYVSSVSSVTYYPAQCTLAERLQFVGLWATPIIIEGFVAWILFSRIARRPKPRFYRFVRNWWRTWLIGTLAIPAYAVMATALPPLSIWIVIPLQAVLAVLLCCAPALLARWEWNRRCRRIRPRCANCGYNLTGLPEPRCPECGQPFEAKGDAP